MTARTGAPWRRETEMSIDCADLLRLLPAALGGIPFHRRAGDIEAVDGSRRIRIRLSGAGTRSMGALQLPTLLVTLELTGFAAPERLAFLRRFDLVFQRGGG